MRPQLHISAIDTLSKCGEMFRRRYIEKEIRPPGVSLITGTATHRSVQKNLTAKLETGVMLPEEAVCEIARDALNEEWDKGVFLDDEEKSTGENAARGDAVDKAVRLSRLHRSSKAPSLTPTHVERQFVIELAGYPTDLAGCIDVQEGTACIRDTKTSKKSPSADTAEESDQLSMYAMAVRALDGRFPDRVALDYLVDLKREQKVVTLESTRTADDCAPLLRRVEIAVEAIEKGVFVPARQSDWWCNKRYCGYHDSCRYVRRPTSISLTVKGA